MNTPEKESPKDAMRKEKRIAEEADRLNKEQERRKAYMAREQALEKDSSAREAGRAEKRASDEVAQSAAEQTRKKALAAREMKIAEAQEARRLRDKQQPSE